MNEAVRISPDGFLRTADLAARSDFAIGAAVVSPSARTVSGPGGIADVEPRVMQVLVALAEAQGWVVTRDTLFRRCWGSPNVGEDSLNRAIASVRRLATGVGADSFVVETIPRTGYRLSIVGHTRHADPVHGWSRREVAGGALALAGLCAIGAWGAFKSAQDHEFDRLLQGAADALWDDNQFDPQRSLRLAESAVRLRPGDPRGLGLLALAQTYFAEVAPPQSSTRAVALAGATAQRALAINSREPNALFAMYHLEGSILPLWSRDQRLRQILAADPSNQGAIHELAVLLQSAGYSRESWAWSERGLALQPMSQLFLAGRALKLWIFGRVGEADKVIDQLRSLFPESAWVWWVRFVIYALTNRPLAARAMLTGNPSMLGAPEAAMWHSALDALSQRSPQAIVVARESCIAAARLSADLAGTAAMIMSQLGDLDSAFAIANGFLLSRGAIVRTATGAEGDKADAPARMNTQWLFSPPCEAMRRDPRFIRLCEAIGLTQYWRRRGVEPDYQRGAAS